MLRLKNLLIGVLGLGLNYCIAQEVDWSVMVDTTTFQIKLEEFTQKTQTIHSSFQQGKNISVLDEIIVTTGEFSFKNPSSLRWEYLEPFEYLIVLNSKRVTIKDGGKVSQYDMEANKIFREINDLMIEIVQGNVVNHKKYVIAYFENSSDFKLQLHPRKATMKKFLAFIEISFDRNDLSVSGVKMSEK